MTGNAFSQGSRQVVQQAFRNCAGPVHPLSCRHISLDWWVAIGLSPLEYQHLPAHLANDPLAFAGFGAPHLSSRLRRADSLAIGIYSD